MGYRPDEQSLERPIITILEGIEKLNKAIKERILADDGSFSHISELEALSHRLNSLEFDLIRLKRETW